MRTFHIILAFCAGLFTGYLFFDSSLSAGNIRLTPPGKTRAKANTIDATKSNANVVFKNRNDMLAGQLLIANSQLKESHAALQKERSKIKDMQRRLLSGGSNAIGDSLLKHEVATQIDTLNSVTDSLVCDYENKVHFSESIIAVRDSQIVLCNSAYQEMKSLVQEQVERERQLTENLNHALKQQKRKRNQNRVLAAGMLFVSGLTTSLLIKYRR
ncbi:hypothetical protein CNR22_13530 [Sphingobacteriaceae bacterium]|nr:hypothetical protein CNR22_13530 [Sphingobacteriaceae bacterium]